MEYVIILILSLSGFIGVHAQVLDSINQDVSPHNGINQIALKYYGINFTKEQRELIKDVEIEFIYSIDEKGIPTLGEINGVVNEDIIDSLIRKTAEIGTFNPQIRNGVAVPSIYFMKLRFPTYIFTQSSYGLLQGRAYNEAKLEDFEYINESGGRIDMNLGGLVNQFIRNPAQYLGTGGGMRFDIGFSGKNDLIFGLHMSFYANELKKRYSITSTREQNKAPSTLLTGLTFGKWFGNFNVISEISIGVQNIMEKQGDEDPDWIQLKGWSPGLLINYPIKLGKSTPRYYYGSPSLLENNLNFHFGLKYMKLSIQEATGFMVELGVSYRITVKSISEYKFKEDFINDSDYN